MLQLSIITVNLNNRQGLKKTIDSVACQIYREFEFLVIDGGSTDGSVDLIRQAGTLITKWLSEPDNGIYEAMNKGIRFAKGEYILFLNSGDWLADDKVLAKVFSERPKEDIVSGNVFFFDTDIEKVKWLVPSPEKITARALFHGYIPHQASFIRRELFYTVGMYNENLKIASDWQFFLKAFLDKGATYKHIDFPVAYFAMDGISCRLETRDLPRKEQMALLRERYPLFIPDMENLERLDNEVKAWKTSREFKVYKFLEKIGIIRLGVFFYRVFKFFNRKLDSKVVYSKNHPASSI